MESRKWDWLGLFFSFICLVHCLILPFFLISLPLLARYYLTHPLSHFVLAIIIIPIALIALFKGYGQHKKIGIFYLGFLSGFFLLLYPILIWFLPELKSYEVFVVASSSVLLMAAHFFNIYFTQTCHIK